MLRQLLFGTTIYYFPCFEMALMRLLCSVPLTVLNVLFVCWIELPCLLNGYTVLSSAVSRPKPISVWDVPIQGDIFQSWSFCLLWLLIACDTVSFWWLFVISMGEFFGLLLGFWFFFWFPRRKHACCTHDPDSEQVLDFQYEKYIVELYFLFCVCMLQVVKFDFLLFTLTTGWFHVFVD